MAASKKIPKKVAKKVAKKVSPKILPDAVSSVIEGDMFYIEITNQALTQEQKDKLRAWLDEAHTVVKVAGGSGGVT